MEMHAKRVLRILLEILLPGFLGSLILIVYFGAALEISIDSKTIFFVLVYACMFVGIQSLFYAAIMEFMINQSVTFGRIVIYSGLIGGVSGSIVSLFPTFSFDVFKALSSAGLLVGFLIPILLLPFYPKGFHK